MLELQTTQQNLQQTNVSNLLQDNWAALASMDYTKLWEMLQSWQISPTDYSTMSWYMQTLWISQLQTMWAVQPQDIQYHNSEDEKC
jgi:hypothetical protein